MRIAALVCADGVLPLGPGFISKSLRALGADGPEELASNGRFQRNREVIPGEGTKEQPSFIEQGLGAIAGWVTSFIGEYGVTTNKVLGSVKGISDCWEGSLDRVAAAIDMTTDNDEHTGIQTVCQRCIGRAAAEV